MHPKPSIEHLSEKKLVGKSLGMSLADNRTAELWRSFMPLRKKITDPVSNTMFALRVYDKAYDFKSIDPRAGFEKWAAVEVSDLTKVPAGLESFVIPTGLYAVFHYKGLNTDPGIFRYIFGEWLPASPDYELDHRPHFETLGELYKNNDPDSEEDIWLPIRLKT